MFLHRFERRSNDMIKRMFSSIQHMVAGTSHMDADIEIKGVTTDSRNVAKGNLFIPLIGEKFNGHEFVEKAFANGAAAALWAKGEPNPPKGKPIIFVEDTLVALQKLAESYLREVNPKVVAITGSNGKTTTKDLVASVLSTTYHVHKTEGNFNNHIGLPLTVLNMPPHTEAAVLEMGMSGRGEIELLSQIAKPDIAVITNIGEAHLMDLGSREAIAEAKLEIVRGLKEDGVFIYHGDEQLLRNKIHSFYTKTFGESKQNDIYPISITQTENGTEFVCNGFKNQKFFIPILGRHNVMNALVAVLAGQLLNVAPENIEKGLKNVEMSSMRLEMVKADSGLTIINDAYNASPTSMKAAIQLVRDMTGFSQKILVLGDMLELGEQEISFHIEVGKTLEDAGIDHLFTYGELGKEIANGAKDFMDESRIHVFLDKQKLIETLRKMVTPNDLVLVKASRGMKLEEVVHALAKG